MRPDDIGRLSWASEPVVSPDGSAVACTVTAVDLDANGYRSTVWLCVDGQPARGVTTGEFRDGRPRWSPDGRTLAFVSHRVSAGDPDQHGCELYVLPMAGPGETRRVAAWPEEIEDLAWSPDGTRLAFTARLRNEERYGPDRDRFRPPVRVTRLFSRLDNVGWVVDRPRQLFVVPADGSTEPVALTTGSWEVSGLTWSPAGDSLAFASARHETWDLDRAVDLWTIPAAVAAAVGGAADPVQLTETGLAYALPSWSPDGSRLAFTVADPRIGPSHAQVGMLDLGTGELTTLTESLDRNCEPFGASRAPVWVDEEVLFSAEDAGGAHLYAVGIAGKPRLMVGGPLQVKGFDAVSGTLAYCAGNATDQAELFVDRTDGGPRSPTRMTSAGTRLSAVVESVFPERFIALSTGKTDVDVEAWVMRPAGCVDGQKYPTLLNIHGGPFSQYGYTLFDEFQIQAHAGYAVLYCNPRGSSGYSEAWGRAVRWPGAVVDPGTGWGGCDYDDLMAVVDEAIRRFPFIDPDRLGVLGGSYGGYMTSWIIGHTDRFKAACSERAANNLLGLEATSDIAGAFVDYVGVLHVDDPDAYLRHSPIIYVKAMTTPLLILHSESDLRCPISQAEELFVALRLLHREVEFVRFPGESHELSRSGAPRHRVQRAELIVEWFDRHLR